jgi:uncharacterized protein YjiK
MELIRFKFLFTAILLITGCKSKSPSDKNFSGDSVSQTSSAAIYPAESDSGPNNLSSRQNPIPFPYDLQQPSEKYKMPKALTEISAIDVYKKSKLVCVQDQDGEVFIYDIKKSEVKRPIPFGKKGDYEGIANVNDTIYVLSSNGNLHQILYFDSPEQTTREFHTPLNKENNTEGLCFDSANYRLMIACKNDPGNNLKGVRAVYAFDLRTMKLNEQPVFKIQLDVLKSFLMKTNQQKLLSEELKDLFDPEKGDVTFQPSEIAVHPLTGDFYIISTVGKLMVVLDRNGEIKSIESLSSDIFKQPEGICFKRDGTMFISDEGRSGHGNILEFKYHPDAK